jgi:hypothetical protein
MAELCTPAMLYLIISGIVFIIMTLSNKFDWKIVLFQLFCIFLWTWVLNLICSSGYPTISWILILIPFFMYLVK